MGVLSVWSMSPTNRSRPFMQLLTHSQQKQQSLLNFTDRSGGETVVSFLEACSQSDPVSDVVDVSMEQVISDEMDTYHLKDWTVRLPDPTRSQVCEVCTLEDPDEWWTYQRKIGNSFPLLYEV